MSSVHGPIICLTQCDPTGEVDLESAAEVKAAIAALLDRIYPNQYDAVLLERGFSDLTSAFAGQYPGLLRCDTLYHDLRHAMETGLATARLLDGHARLVVREGGVPIDARHAVLAVLLALFHDIGLLRRDDEAHVWGPALTPVHEERGVEFMESYLRTTSLADLLDQAKLIMATKLIFRMPPTWSEAERTLASIIATADLLSQLADRCYLEKCRDFLFLEFSAFGLAGKDGSPYPDRETLLAKTPDFFNGIIRNRLDQEFQGVHRLLDQHYGTPNPWVNAIERNLDYLAEILETRDFARLRRQPKPFVPIS